MDLNLAGKVALVTGAARGVGRDIAITLAAEGAAVAVNYASSADEAHAVVAAIEATGGKAMACGADVGDYAAVQRMVADIVGRLGGLNILVNNAGLALRRRFVETTPAEWRRQIDASSAWSAIPPVSANPGCRSSAPRAPASSC
jgi:NAD(P)-dependent dehydrogenase (short-subunit alcohol dehydrogenase family)